MYRELLIWGGESGPLFCVPGAPKLELELALGPIGMSHRGGRVCGASAPVHVLFSSFCSLLTYLSKR